MKSKFTYRMLLAGLLISLASCIYDDLELNDGPIGKGEGNVSFSVTFDALTASRLGKQSRSTQGIGGDAIRNINDLCILWYDLEGNLAGSRYLERSQLTIDEIDRPASQTDAKTEQATFETRIPYGRYRMYAVANMGDLSASHAAAIAKEQDFRVISLAWEPGDIRKNCEMSGYFTQTDTSSASEDNEAPEITVNRTYTKLHAWIRRAASKVTVSFDTEKLYDNVYVYIKSARICNVPRTCTLIENNDETRINKETDLHPAGDTIEYGSGPDFTPTTPVRSSSTKTCRARDRASSRTPTTTTRSTTPEAIRRATRATATASPAAPISKWRDTTSRTGWRAAARPAAARSSTGSCWGRTRLPTTTPSATTTTS